MKTQNYLINFLWKKDILPQNELSELEQNIISQKYQDLENLDKEILELIPGTK